MGTTSPYAAKEEGAIPLEIDREEAVRAVEALALRVMAERVEAGKEEEFASLSFAVPA